MEPGTTVADIMDHDALTLPGGYRTRLVTETAEVLKFDSKVWESQAFTLVRFKHVVQASSRMSVRRRELVFVDIPMGTAKVGNGAFQACVSLQEAEIPNSAISIQESAFSSCISLEHVEIPESVKSIGPKAFSGCRAMENLGCFRKVYLE